MDIMLERIVELIGPKHGSSKMLADYLGIHPNVITNWKNGRNKSYRGYLPQIADYFNVSVDYLLGNEQKEKPHADESSMRPNEKLLLENFRELSPEMQEFVLSSVLAQSDKLKKEQNQ